MTFTPKTWRDYPSGGTPITADELNRVEQSLRRLLVALPDLGQVRELLTKTLPTLGQVKSVNGRRPGPTGDVDVDLPPAEHIDAMVDALAAYQAGQAPTATAVAALLTDPDSAARAAVDAAAADATAALGMVSITEHAHLVTAGNWAPALAAALATGRAVYFPPGDYPLTTTTTWAGTAHLVGAPGAVLHHTGTYVLNATGTHAAEGHTLTIEGLEFVGAPAPLLRPNRFAIRAEGYAAVTVTGCAFRHCDEFPLFVADSTNVRVLGNSFLSSNTSTGDADTLGRYINLGRCTGVRIRDNYFTSAITYQDGAAFGSVSTMMSDCVDVVIQGNTVHEAGGFECYSACENVTVADNTITNCHRYAIKLEESSNLKVLRNTIRNAYASTARFVIGVMPYTRMHSYGSTVTRRGRVLIEGNIIDTCPQPYLIIVQGRTPAEVAGRLPEVTQADLLVYDVTVRDNSLRNSPCTVPINLRLNQTVLVEDNVVSHCNPTAFSAPYIFVNDVGYRAEVLGNRIELASAAPLTLTGIAVNALTLTGRDTWAHVERNTIANVGAVAQVYGIDINRLTRQRILRNHITGMTQHLFARGGGDLLVNDNHGFTADATTILTGNYTKVVSDL